VQEGLVKKLGLSDVVKVVSANADEDVVEVINKAWPVQASQSVFVSPDKRGTVTKLAESGWNILYSGMNLVLFFHTLYNLLLFSMSRHSRSYYTENYITENLFHYRRNSQPRT
jgi:hypothetical protein